MNDYIVAFDVETTGLSQKDDFVIQLSAIKFKKFTFEIVKELNYYIKPCLEYIISPGAFQAHGLTKEFIAENGVSLKSIAPEFLDMIEDSDYLTFNGNRFDVNILYKDLLMVGYEFPMTGKIFYDSYGMEVRLSPRNLSTVYTKYTGKILEDAHNSLADVKATIDVFKAQFESIEDDIDEWPENKLYSPEGSIRNAANVNEPERIVFSIGKYKDVEFMEVCKKDPQYISWFKDKVASPYTWRLLSRYYKEHRND